MDVNRFYAVRDSYQIPATIVAGGGGIAVGRGIDMTDPQYPLLVPDVVRFFSEPMRLMGAASEEAYEVTGDAIKDTFALLQSDTEQSEATTLNTYFRGSYNVSNLSVALARAREFRRESHSAYVLLTHRGDSRVMTPQLWHVREDLRPLAEDLEDDEAAFTQFRRDFGTHYIHAVTYGLTIAIRGSLRSTDEQERLSLGTRLKAGFGAFKAEAGVDATTKNQLQSGDLDLTCEVNCGGTVPARPLMMSSFEEIATFLKEIGEGRIRFKLAPVEIHLASYWSLLDPARLPRCRSLLDPARYGSRFTPPAGAYGVPAGTIIAWRPSPAHIEDADDPSRAVLRVPDGWALCDGQDGRPDLQDRFICGTHRLGEVGETGGAATHDHQLQLQTGTVARVSGLVTAGTTAVVGGKIAGQTILPPFVKVVYIIKLDETH
jgi:hypothetical protein